LSGSKLPAWVRGIPPEAIVVGVALFALLALFVSADPAPGVSWSSGALGDEWYNVISARNLVVVGQWATDGWDHHLVNLPFSLVIAAAYAIFGVGIVAARLVTIAFVSLTAAALVWGLRGVVGRVAAIFGGLAFATSGLILYYGRLAFLEDLVVLGTTLGLLVLARSERLSTRGGVLAGLWFVVAIGSKPNSAFSVLGIVVALAVVWGRRDASMRRWLVGACTTIAVAGLAWGLLIFLPNREAVITDIRIWSPGGFYLTPAEILNSINLYFQPDNYANDGLYGMQLGSLIVLGSIGVVLAAILRDRVTAAEARLAVASIGWLLFGFGILVMTSYRPNRYAVPLAAPLAILAAIGLRLAISWVREKAAARAIGRALGPSIAAVAIVVAVVPGLNWYRQWAPSATHQLAAIEDTFARVAPPGERIAGNHAAQYLLDTRNPLVVTGIANNGDYYSTGIRWYLAQVTDGPPPGVPVASWAARTSVACVQWRGLTVECLYQVP
jgi:4-amino-4-deoxy-L-arabinose transferase-like glycosyltransferase